MSASSRRGACPSLAAPMPTGDGMLVRIVTTGSTIGFRPWAALCAAARRHGNGIVEITVRGSIQVRGLSPQSAPDFAQAVAALDIAAAGIPILLDPLAHLDPHALIDANRPAADLRGRLAEASFAAMLGPKVSVVIDAGATLHLDAVAADVRLRAGLPSGNLHLALGGDAATAMPLGAVAERHASEAAFRLLEMIAKHGPGARARDLLCQRDSIEAFRAAIPDLLMAAAAPAVRSGAEPIGRHLQRDGSVALGIGLAFGHTDVDALEALIAAAERAGGCGIRTAAGRALLIIGLAPDAAGALAAQAEALGFVARSDDRRRFVVACPGAPICASGEIPARALGPLISIAAAPLLDSSLTVHVSGCPKGCAHPGPAALTVVGMPAGCGLVLNGCARDRPFATIGADALPASVARMVALLAEAGRG
jgi:precorrin-3B synthase